MPLLLESGRTELWRGDMVRLAENDDLSPGSDPVDPVVYEPHDDACGLGLMVASGDKAGLTWVVLPLESTRDAARCIDIAWLKRNWDTWIAYQWDGRMRVIDIARTELLEWDRRTILETA